MVSVFGVAYFGKSGLPVTQESAKRAEVPHGQTRGKMVGRWEVIICGQMGECGRLSVNVLARWCYKARYGLPVAKVKGKKGPQVVRLSNRG